MRRRRLLLGLGAAGVVPAGAAPSTASSPWPTRPLRVVVPFQDGGAVDLVARMLAPELQRELGRPVRVDNRPGSSGHIGCAEVAGASDGHTLLIGTLGTHVINPLLSRHLPYDAVKDFAPIGAIARVPLVLVANPVFAQGLGLRSVGDLVRAAKARPGRLHTASGGNGSPTHLAGELFKRLTGTFMLNFPYRSSASAQQDVIAGNMDLMFETLPAALPQIRAGRLLALGLTSAQRSPAAPELPTLDEAGGPALQGFEASSWVGLFAPASQPPDQVLRLQRALAAASAGGALRERLAARGLLALAAGGAELAGLMAAESVKWAGVVTLSGVKVDP